MAAAPVFDPLRDRVENALGVATLDITYGPLSDFESIAERLAERIREELPAEMPVAIVGHSLGGLVARWYLQQLGGRARRLVTLATPHGGTTRANKIPGPLAQVLRPGSRVLGRLVDTAGDVALFAVVAGRDRLVTPPESAGAIRDAEVVRYELGHNQILYDAAVQRRVVTALGDG